MQMMDAGLLHFPAHNHANIQRQDRHDRKKHKQRGNSRAANTVMLGFWTAAIGAVSEAAMRQAVAESVPSKTVEVNMQAFDIGFQRGVEVAARDK